MSRPQIVVYVSTSLDGRVSLRPNQTMWDTMADPGAQEPGDRESWEEFEGWVTSTYSPQANMLGSNSLTREGEELKALPPFEGNPDHLYRDFLPDNVVKRPDHKGWLVVVDGRGRLRSGYKGEDNPGWHILHLVSRGVTPEYLAFLQSRDIPYLIAGDKVVDLKEVMEKLKTKLGVNRLVTSAGGRLAGALLRAGLVDDVNILIRPQLIGGFETPSLFDSQELAPGELPTKLSFTSAQIKANGYLWLQYRVMG